MPNSIDHSQGANSAYRAYVIGDEGRIETSTDILVASDEEAIEQARQLVDDHVVELWDRGRMLIRIEPDRCSS